MKPSFLPVCDLGDGETRGLPWETPTSVKTVLYSKATRACAGKLGLWFSRVLQLKT